MKFNIKNSIVTAVIVMVGISSSAFAGGAQVDDKSLTDVLVAKGILSKGDVQAIKHNNDGKLKFEAEVFGSIKTVKEKSATATTNDFEQAAIDRAYLTAKYSFNNDWMMRVTTDVFLDTKNGNGANNKKNNRIFLKYAYLQGKLYGDAVVLRLGQSHTPWIDHEEHLWAHRYVSPVFIDTHGFDASSDLGIGLKGKLSGGLFKYWVTETNGRGYSHPGLNAAGGKGTKSFDFDSRLGIYPMQGLTVDFQYRNGYLGTKYFDTVNKITTPGTRSSLYQAMITYGMGHDWRVGANYVHNKKHDSATLTDIKDDGYALWGWTGFGNGFGSFGRYEYDKTKKTNAIPNQTENRYQLGLEYKPVKNVALSLVYDYDKIRDKGHTTGAVKKTSSWGLFSNFKY